MRILYSFLAMSGLVIWYMGAKVFSGQNVLSALFVTGLGYVTLMPIASKLLFGKRVDFGAVPLGLANMIGGGFLATVFLVLALHNGGKVAVVSVIVESSIIVSVLLGVYFFREQLTWQQVLGIVMVVVGLVLVIAYNKGVV